MKRIRLDSIASKVGKYVTNGTGKEFFNDFSIDSRTLKPDDLFIALKGPNNDGHDYLKQAKEKGAAAFVVEKDISINKPYILVDDCYKFLDQLGSYQREEFTGKVIGLTGSNGKTTTKEIIYSLLSDKGCCKTKESRNNHIGVPLTLASLKESYNYAVIEIGTNAPGEIGNLAAKVVPDIALITNAGPSHLEKLKSKENVAEEKSSLLKYLKKDGTAVLPRDSEFFSFWEKKCQNRKVISFGVHKQSDISISNVQTDFFKNKINFDLNYSDNSIQCSMNGIAYHNALNACSALAVCKALNINLKDITVNLSKIIYPSRRMEVHKAIKGSLLIDDSYNANPESMKKSLDVLEGLRSKKRIFVAGEMAELGNDKVSFHNDICKYAKGRVEEFLCIGDLWKDGIKHIPKLSKRFPSKIELLDYLNTKVSKNSIILVKGSRSTGMDYFVDQLKL